jgi:hypothetical protein
LDFIQAAAHRDVILQLETQKNQFTWTIKPYSRV